MFKTVLSAFRSTSEFPVNFATDVKGMTVSQSCRNKLISTGDKGGEVFKKNSCSTRSIIVGINIVPQRIPDPLDFISNVLMGAREPQNGSGPRSRVSLA